PAGPAGSHRLPTQTARIGPTRSPVNRSAVSSVLLALMDRVSMEALVTLGKRMNPAWIGVAALAFGLTACGGGGGGGGTSSTGVTTTPTESTAADSSQVPAGLTPPGTRLALGQKATVGWVPPDLTSGPGDHKGYRLQVTVESIVKGKIADFK